MKRAARLIVLLGVMAVTGTAQSPLVVRGRVFAADGTPLHNVRVQASATSQPPPVFSDAEGAFAVTANAGATLSVTKSGYLPATIAVRNASEIRLVKAAAISGRIVDPAGDALTGMTVEAHRVRDGTLSPESTTTATAIVDDLGHYRVSGLREGRYEVSVIALSPIMMPDGRLIDPSRGSIKSTAIGRDGQPITTEQAPFSTRSYYPGVLAAQDAQPITVAAGEDRPAIDFVAAGQPIVPFPTAGAGRGGPQPTYRGSIEGTVVGPDGRAVAQALVHLESEDFPSFPPVVVTDAAGRYVFNRLPSIDYRINVTKSGFLTGWWAEQQPADFGDAIELGASQAVKHVDIRMTRAGAIEGRVTDERGDPVEGAVVQVLEARYEDGQRQLVDAGDAGVRRTDDRGHYRIYGLDPGRYLIRVRVGHIAMEAGVSDLSGYAPTYLPSAVTAADAQIVVLDPGQNLTGADVALVKAPTARVSGRIVSPAGRTGGSLTISPTLRSGAMGDERVGGRRLPDGAFEFPNVAPGEYVIQSFEGANGRFTDGEFGFRFITVNGIDVEGVTVPRSVGSTAAGRFIDDTGAQTVAHAEDIMAVPVDPERSPHGTGAHSRFTGDLAFEIVGLNGPHLFRVDKPNAGWMLKAVRWNGRDITDTPIEFGSAEQSISGLEIVMTRNTTEVAGAVTDARGRAVPHASVIVFPANRTLWGPFSRFLMQARTDRAGAFVMQRLPPGDYFAAAVVGVKDGDLQDPVRLEALTTSASRVVIGEGEKVQVALRLAR